MIPRRVYTGMRDKALPRNYWRRYPATGVSTKGGWFTIRERTYYYKSRLEVRIACHWENMRQLGLIENWWYEDRTFRFPQKKKGITEYTPDFCVSVKLPSGYSSVRCVEVKGYVDLQALVKLRLMMETYPGYGLLLFIQNKQALYRSLERQKDKGSARADLILSTLLDWDSPDPVASKIKIVDWAQIVRSNQYGEALFNLATPADKPKEKRPRNQRRLIVNFEDQRNIP